MWHSTSNVKVFVFKCILNEEAEEKFYRSRMHQYSDKAS